MQTVQGGRPETITTDDVVAVGRRLGMRDLTLRRVAHDLGVSAPALYRLVDGRLGLERLVGESLLADMRVVDDPARTTKQQLVAFALQLRSFLLDHAGLATYVQALFPRGEAGRRIMASAIDMLVARGYRADAAIVLCGAVAAIAIGLTAAEDAAAALGDDGADARSAALDGVRRDPALQAAHHDLPDVSAERYTRLVMTAAVNGLVDAGPPGRSVDAVIRTLEHDVPPSDEGGH